LTGVSVNTDSLEDNIALLGFKLAANNALAKYNLVDRTIDEYQDATGIDASASTGEGTGGTGTGKYYSSRYTATDYHTTDSDTMFLLQSNSSANGNATFTDTSGNNATLSAVGSMTHSTSEAKFGSSALKFNGSSGITIASGDIQFPASDWTLEYWIKHPIGSMYNARVVGHSPGGNNNQFFIRPYTTVDANGYALVYHGWGGVSGQFTGAGVAGADLIQTNNWVHVAVVQEGSRMRQFVNGVNQGDWALNSNCNGGNPSASPVDVWEIGFKGGTNNEFLTNGTYLDDIRFSTVARYTGTTTYTPNATTTTSATMSLQSTSTTASTAPTKGDITVLIEDNLGTATINTDIKGYVSRNGGTGWDQGTLVHEGSWGTNRKVLSFHDQTFSNSASGTDMKYKIETANQSYTAGATVTTAKSHTGADQTFTVPAGVTSITFTGWGGGGGGSAPGVGGGGGYISGPVTVIPGETLDVKVGSGGLSHQNAGMGGSGGGGGTGIYRGATVLAIAGGGGGGVSNQRGGAGGGLVGEVGYDTRPGQGGTQSAGGAAAQRTNNGGGTTPISGGDAGSLNQGGHACNGSSLAGEPWNPVTHPGAYNGGGRGGGDLHSYTSSGGGGGYYGGSGGGMGGNGSGGGGSSLTTGTNTQATGQSTPETSHANYVAGVGNGGASYTNGENGHAVITYTSAPTGKQTRIHATSLAWS
jgi:hypothetical protein